MTTIIAVTGALASVLWIVSIISSIIKGAVEEMRNYALLTSQISVSVSAIMLLVSVIMLLIPTFDTVIEAGYLCAFIFELLLIAWILTSILVLRTAFTEPLPYKGE